MAFRRMAVLLAAAALLVCGSGRARAQDTQDAPVLRISTENGPDHVQTLAVARFAAVLEERSQGRLRIEHHYSGRLYRDKDVLAALAGGKVDMAVPGIWQFGQLVPDVGLFLLPDFFGRSASEVHRVSDGEVGRILGHRIETAADCHVMGRWLDLGHAHLFGLGDSLRSHASLKGKVFRVAGGAGNIRRLEAFGARAVVIPWPDLPARLDQGVVDGLLTSFETVRSARLWERGIGCALEDSEYFPQYVPVMSSLFWRRLPPDLRKLVTDVWEELVDRARLEAAVAQQDARREMIAHGVVVSTPTREDTKRWRKVLRASQDDIAREIGVDPRLCDMAARELEGR